MRLSALKRRLMKFMQNDRLLQKHEWESEVAINSLLTKGLIEEVFNEDGESLGYRRVEGVSMECYEA